VTDFEELVDEYGDACFNCGSDLSQPADRRERNAARSAVIAAYRERPATLYFVCTESPEGGHWYHQATLDEAEANAVVTELMSTYDKDADDFGPYYVSSMELGVDADRMRAVSEDYR